MLARDFAQPTLVAQDDGAATRAPSYFLIPRR